MNIELAKKALAAIAPYDLPPDMEGVARLAASALELSAGNAAEKQYQAVRAMVTERNRQLGRARRKTFDA